MKFQNWDDSLRGIPEYAYLFEFCYVTISPLYCK